MALGAVPAAHVRRTVASHIPAHLCADTALTASYAGAWSALPYGMTLHGALETYREARRRNGRTPRSPLCRDYEPD